jgi:hypothetical protein
MKHFFTLAFLTMSAVLMAQVGLITWEVNMANETVSPEGVFIAGGDYFGLPGDNAMSDDDGDGVWTITIAMPFNYTGAYTFTNGACADYSCKENIVGQSCAFGTWSDRELPTVTGDATYSTCFSQCSTDGSCASVSAVDVTFRVDMSEQVVTEGVFLHAAFDGWGSIPMLDDDGNNIYEHTASLESGSSYEFLYQNGPGGNESFDSTYVECTLTSGEYTNRILTLEASGDFSTDAYCFNSCSACSDTTGGGGDGPFDVTFNVNMANEEVDPTGVFLAGGADFGSPGDNEMTDQDGDGVYSITVSLDEGYTGFYTFTNGACGDYSCKEDLSGLPCGDADNFNDRTVGPISGNTTISTCFGQCSTDGSCENVDIASVTFRVDMSEAGAAGDVNIFGGSINGWNNTATSLTDADGDGIYEVTLELSAGGHEYKFLNNGSEEVFDPLVHGECTLTTGEYTNRYLMIDGSEPVITMAYCFNSCTECETVNRVSEQNAAAFELFPTLTSDATTLRFPVALASQLNLSIVGFSGAIVSQCQIPAGSETWTIDLAGYAPGIYFVNSQTSGMSATRRLMVTQ